MLNISDNSIKKWIKLENFRSYKVLRKSKFRRLPLLLFSLLLLLVLIGLFVPWTQNINAKGYVTTRSPEQRPQGIQSVIAGRIEKWYVQEGDYVKAGDTIVFLSEVKSDYFDPDLIERTQEQLDAKSQSISVYESKVDALRNQLNALEDRRELKLSQNKNKLLQAKNKVIMDSIDLRAQEVNIQIAENQLERTQELYEKGLKSLSDLQEKELKKQEVYAKLVVQQNKLANQKNELTIIEIERSSIGRDFADKIAKSQSEIQSALSAQLESVASTSKLKNQLGNYTQRQGMYHIRAPQSGYITQTITKGIGETVKEGADIATIMPEKYDLALELYLRPQDIPLLSLGLESRIRFDGWPAIVISGWPETSTGIFTGEVVAIDRFTGTKGFYRILISPEESEKAWPNELMVGTGAQAFILLKDVPIWYEIWRQLNGFPMEFYGEKEKKQTEIKRKAPLKSVK